MDRTRAPLVVLKPVRTTMASATASSSSVSCGLLARMIFVPQKRKNRATLGWIEVAPRSIYGNASSVVGTFDTGIDSPITVSFGRHMNDRRTCQHAFVDDAITRKEQAITWKLR